MWKICAGTLPGHENSRSCCCSSEAVSSSSFYHRAGSKSTQTAVLSLFYRHHPALFAKVNGCFLPHTGCRTYSCASSGDRIAGMLLLTSAGTPARMALRTISTGTDRWYKARILPAGRPAENFVRSILSARKKHPPPGIFRPGSGCFPLYYGERCRRFTLRQHSW